MKTFVSALFAVAAMFFLAAPAAKAAENCTTSQYRLGNPSGAQYSLQICGHEVKILRDQFAFFDGNLNEEGNFLEGSVQFADRCGAVALPASSDEMPDWFRAPPKTIVVRATQPTNDSACRKTGEEEITYRFVTGGAAASVAGGGEGDGQCWLVVYGMFARGEFDDAKKLVAKIGEGTSVADTDSIRSLPKGRFAVIGGPFSESDADATQQNTRPVAPNSVIVAANDCGDAVAAADNVRPPVPGPGIPKKPFTGPKLSPPAKPPLFEEDESDADAPVADRQIDLHAEATIVGKWPEGVAFDGSNLWVAVSGDRQIARVDAGQFTVTSRVNVGRLPVGMVTTGNGRILALLRTDKKVWQQSTAGGKSGVFFGLTDCPNVISADDSFVWVATDTNCQSGASKIFQFDASTGRQVKRYNLDANLLDMSAGHNGVFTVHALNDESIVRAIDPSNGAIGQLELPGLRLLNINAGNGGVFAGGIEGDGGVVVSLADRFGQIHLDQQILALTATDEGIVAAVGKDGAIYVLNGTDGPRLLYTINTDFGAFEPRAVLALGDRLYITTQRGQGEKGSLLMIDNWRQGDAAAGLGD